jgi:hypothetical protein
MVNSIKGNSTDQFTRHQGLMIYYKHLSLHEVFVKATIFAVSSNGSFVLTIRNYNEQI